MKKSTVKRRIISHVELDQSELIAFDTAYFHLKDTLEAIERIQETETLVIDDPKKLREMTAYMQTISEEILQKMSEAFIALPY